MRKRQREGEIQTGIERESGRERGRDSKKPKPDREIERELVAPWECMERPLTQVL
jgi:hypothetical protein